MRASYMPRTGYLSCRGPRLPDPEVPAQAGTQCGGGGGQRRPHPTAGAATQLVLGGRGNKVRVQGPLKMDGPDLLQAGAAASGKCRSLL